MLIETAFAQDATGMMNQNALMGYLPILLIFAVFYFLIIRPQSQRAKAHAEMVAALHRGDKVITSGGVHGEISKVIDDYTVELEIAKGTHIFLTRTNITEVVSKGTETAKNTKKKQK